LAAFGAGFDDCRAKTGQSDRRRGRILWHVCGVSSIAAIIAIFGLLADPAIVSDQLALMEGIIPPDAYDIFANQIGRLLLARSDTLGWATILSILLALWSSRAGVAALMSGLNAIAGTPSRNGFWQAIVALALTISRVTLLIVALLAVVVAPVVLAFMPLAWSTVCLLEGLRWFIALSVLLLDLGCCTDLALPVGPSGGAGLRLVLSAWLFCGSRRQQGYRSTSPILPPIMRYTDPSGL
jgi:hypothetical protein